MMRTILLYILLLLSALLTFSCKERPELSSTLDRAETLIWESPDSALQLLEALPTSKRIDEESRARHALLLSQARYRCYIPTTSDSLINIALEYYQRRSDKTDELATAWFYKAALAKDMGCPHEEYLPYYKEAEALIPKLNDNYLIARIYHSLGLVNDDASYYHQAKGYYQKALNVNRLIRDIESQVSNLINLTNTYVKMDEYDSAEYCVKQLLNSTSEVKDKNRLSNLYHCVGYYFDMQGQLEKGICYYQKALEIKHEQKTLTCLASAYMKMRDYVKADSLYNSISEQLNLESRLILNYDLYLKSKEQKNYAKAIDYADSFISLSDEYYTYENEINIDEIQRKYDLAALEIQNSRTQRYWLYFCMSLLIVACIVWAYYKKRQKRLLVDIIFLQEALLEEKTHSASYLEEKDLLKSELEKHRKKTEKDFNAMKKQYKYILSTKDRESNGMYVLRKIIEEEQYNPNTDRESLKFCLSLTHKQFMDVLDKKYPNMPNRIADVCYLAALGLNVRQIAKLLGVSDISVRQYMNRFCKEIELQESGKKAFYAYIYSSLMD